MKKKSRAWVWALVGVAGVAAAGVVVRRRAARPPEIDQSLVVKVKRADLQIDVIETGKVQPREKVEVKSKVAGQVERVFVTEGQLVKKGQMLLRLDATDFRRELARTEAEVAQAKNGLEFAQQSLGRKQKAAEARAVAQAEVDLAENEVRVRTVSLRMAEVARDAALDRLRYTEIAAPLAGTVIQRGIEVGEVVTPGVQATFEGKPLLTIADLSQLLVRAELNQIDVAKVHVKQQVTLTLDALPGKKYRATVTRVAPASVVAKGKDVDVFPIEATLADADGAIRPGMTADVRIHVETRPGVLLLPIEAVVKEKDKHYVTRVVPARGGVAGQTTERTDVTVGAHNDREMEVVSGVGDGDPVLIKPASAAENEARL